MDVFPQHRIYVTDEIIRLLNDPAMQGIPFVGKIVGGDHHPIDQAIGKGNLLFVKGRQGYIGNGYVLLRIAGADGEYRPQADIGKSVLIMKPKSISSCCFNRVSMVLTIRG